MARDGEPHAWVDGHVVRRGAGSAAGRCADIARGAGRVVGRGVAVLAAGGLLLGLTATTATAEAERTPPRAAASVTAPVDTEVGTAARTLLQLARQYVGTPYVWGGQTPAGFDCSGYTQYVFSRLGVDLPRTADAQRHAGTVVPASQARPGDLVWRPGHVAIYTGNGNHIAARNPTTPLHEGPISMADPVFVRVLAPDSVTR